MLLPRKFGVFVGLSLFSHLVLLGILLMMGRTPHPGSGAADPSNLRAFSRALMEMERDGRRLPLSGRPSTSEALKDIEGDPGSLFRFATGISEQDKVRFFRSVLESEKIPDAGLPIETATGDFYVTPASTGDGYQVDKVGRAVLDRLGQLGSGTKSPAAADRAAAEAEMARAEQGPADVPPEYLYRESPFAEILARGPNIFTVFRGFPDLAGMLRTAPAKEPGDPERDRAGALPFESGIIFLSVRFTSGKEDVRRAVLGLSPEEQAKALDELMAMKEPDELDAFKNRYLDAYDPDLGDLASLTREFCYSNLNSIFIVTDLVTSTFDAIEGIHFKKPVYDFYTEYGRRLFKTRTGTALLLNVASAYDFERRTLQALFAARGPAHQAMTEPGEAPGRYQPRLKAFVVDELYRLVSDLCGSMRLSPEDLSDLYIRREEEIYELLAALGGEAMNRALYDWGRLDWERERFAAAIEKWKKADMSFPLPSRAFRRIRGMIDRYDVTTSATALNDLDHILADENVVDRQNLLERHVKFNTWKKRAD